MMQDFVGFTYNGYHSIRDLGIYRTSNSNRYDESLTATMQDKTTDVPGRDGQYYFGTTFKNRTFTVNYAFHNLSESKIRKIKEVFAGDGIHELVFDETPYKAWSAKVTGTASMKHLCFEEKGKRVYKGEGSITFTCYYPYAHTPTKLWQYKTNDDGETIIVYAEADGKFLNNYNSEIYTNKNEWAETSGLDAQYGTNSRIKGDRQIPCIATLTVTQITEQDQSKIFLNGLKLTENGTEVLRFDFRDKDIKQGDIFKWDSKLGILTKQRDEKIEIIPISNNTLYLLTPGSYYSFSPRGILGFTKTTILSYNYEYL